MLSDGTNAYFYGVGRVGEEQPGGWQYYLGDALGSVRQLADGASEVQLAGAYEPFGSELVSAGGAMSIYGFTGEQGDETGLVYLRARYLDPVSGRFNQADPGSVDQQLYAYSGDDPVNFTDPSGLVPVRIWAAAFIKPPFIQLPHVEPRAPWLTLGATFKGDGRDFYDGKAPTYCRVGNPVPSSRLCHSIVLDFSTRGATMLVNNPGVGESQVTFFDLRLLRLRTVKATAPRPNPATIKTIGCITTVTMRARAGVPTEPFRTPEILYEYDLRFDRCLGTLGATGRHTLFPWHELWASGTIRQPELFSPPFLPLPTGLKGVVLLTLGKIGMLQGVYYWPPRPYPPLIGLTSSDIAMTDPLRRTLPSTHIDLLSMASCRRQ